MKPSHLLILALLCTPAAHAESDVPQTDPQQADATRAGMSAADGGETRAWLQLQSSNAQASPTSHALPGPVLKKIYQRYVDSFGRPIPDRFEQFSAKTDSK